ncbi:AAA family ATPase [Amycolatopsis sp. lyj-90]|uniref:AAA family ATPase n=1 Tax=Amycolatopsis sp. lyj-90 TaxID=2789285 RepID=UPI003979CE64
MTWSPYYHGDGTQRRVDLPTPPPWRTFPRQSQHAQFQPPEGLVEAVNAAVQLRRPLLLRGPAGSGKSTVPDQVAHELDLGPVVRWHVTSRSTLRDALYRYDALGRIHAHNLSAANTLPDNNYDDIGDYLQLGPLGTALLPTKRPRALLIDEIDKSDLDLPSDLLDVLERGEFEIPELARHPQPVVSVRTWHSFETATITRGQIACTEFPFIVMTSNDERGFPEAFLRRCIRFAMPPASPEMLHKILAAHLGPGVTGTRATLVTEFVERVSRGERLAVDQLLNAVHLLTDESVLAPDNLRQLLLRELSND